MEPEISIKDKYLNRLSKLDPVKLKGTIVRVVGLTFESIGPFVSVGEKCNIFSKSGKMIGSAEVVGFKDNRVILMPLGEITGVSYGCSVVASGEPFTVPVGENLLGRVINPLGEPIDGKGAIEYEKKISLFNVPPEPLKRRRITEAIPTGIKAIDGVCTVGKGQRLGIFSGSGIGKSILLGMIARNTEADINVIALVGERSREVKDFIEGDLKEKGLERSVVVVVTSSEPALLKIKGAMAATAISEYFREKGKDVMLMMDSATRIAMAQREVGLSAGEPPTSKGYPPSVYSLLPRLLERTGTSENGSITGLYTVLVEGDDITEPISDAMRAILDGHVVLSRKLAASNHYPAIDVLNSISRLAIDITTDEHQSSARKLIDLVNTYQSSEDLINIGAYVKGSNPKIDKSINMIDSINDFLKQGIYESVDYQSTIENLVGLMQEKTEN